MNNTEKGLVEGPNAPVSRPKEPDTDGWLVEEEHDGWSAIRRRRRPSQEPPAPPK
jgi:hypothetical protein